MLLLQDIRDLFDQKPQTELPSAVIVQHLNLLPHGLWADWRGKHDTDTLRPITRDRGQVARTLRDQASNGLALAPRRRYEKLAWILSTSVRGCLATLLPIGR